MTAGPVETRQVSRQTLTLEPSGAAGARRSPGCVVSVISRGSLARHLARVLCDCAHFSMMRVTRWEFCVVIERRLATGRFLSAVRRAVAADETNACTDMIYGTPRRRYTLIPERCTMCAGFLSSCVLTVWFGRRVWRCLIGATSGIFVQSVSFPRGSACWSTYMWT